MKKIVVDMQNFLLGDSIAAAFKNSNYDIDVVRAEAPRDTVELCRVYKPLGFCQEELFRGREKLSDWGKQTGKRGGKCALWTVKTLFRGREYKTLAHPGNEVVAGIKSPYLHLFLHYKQLLYVRISPLLISPHSVPCLRSGGRDAKPRKSRQ